MPLDFLPNPDGSWRAQGERRHYRIVRVREATGTKFRVFQSLNPEPGSGTQAIQALQSSFESAVSWCEAAESEGSSGHPALERKNRT